MGIVNFGIPEYTADFLKQRLNLKIFIEGGTYLGNTAKIMGSKFEKVFTIEKSLQILEKAKQNLKDINNIILLQGDTREYLDKLLQENDNILFWLDSHWCGGESYGKNDECPLLEELKLIFKYEKNYVVLIDDARLFLAPPPLPHNYNNWPLIKDLIELVPSNFEIIIFEDVIYLFPVCIKEDFSKFMQDVITKKMKEKEQRDKINNLIRMPLNIIKGIFKYVFKR